VGRYRRPVVLKAPIGGLDSGGYLSHHREWVHRQTHTQQGREGSRTKLEAEVGFKPTISGV
jgi:hypothetical protein